ncbi:MAG: glycoside hydrolase family 43 protein [Clostridia bacterium]|nr:glycoside hydrolase family 43 protein [Clostridia bacterium]
MSFNNPFLVAADPFVLLHDGKYYLYATTAPDGYLVYESEDMAHWIDRGYCLKKDDVMGEEKFWAPEVIFHNGKFYMVYTSEFHLGIAVSDSPLGPFRQENKRWLTEGRAIDGHFFRDGDRVYMYYVNYEPEGKTNIFGCEMSEDLQSLVGEPRRLIAPEQAWELRTSYMKDGEIRCVVEGPFVLKQEGKYYLTYSANATQSPFYAVGYAVSDSPLGEYKKYSKNPILKKSETVNGTGHHSFTTTKDGKRLICVYHTHNSLTEWKPRMACADYAEFTVENGETVLKIHGPTRQEKK